MSQKSGKTEYLKITDLSVFIRIVNDIQLIVFLGVFSILWLENKVFSHQPLNQRAGVSPSRRPTLEPVRVLVPRLQLRPVLQIQQQIAQNLAPL